MVQFSPYLASFTGCLFYYYICNTFSLNLAVDGHEPLQMARSAKHAKALVLEHSSLHSLFTTRNTFIRRQLGR